MYSQIQLIFCQIFVVIIIGTAAIHEEEQCTIKAPAGSYVLANMQQDAPKESFTIYKSDLIKDLSVDYLKIEHVLTVDEHDEDPAAVYITALTPLFNSSIDLPKYLSFRVVPIRGKIDFVQPNQQYFNLHETTRPDKLFFQVRSFQGELKNNYCNRDIIIIRAPLKASTPKIENMNSYVVDMYQYLLLTVEKERATSPPESEVYVQLSQALTAPNVEYLKITAVSSKVIPSTKKPNGNYLEFDIKEAPEQGALVRHILFKVDPVYLNPKQMDPNGKYIRLAHPPKEVKRSIMYLKIQLLTKQPGDKVGLNNEAIVLDLDEVPRTPVEIEPRAKRNVNPTSFEPEFLNAEDEGERRVKRSMNSTSQHPELPKLAATPKLLPVNEARHRTKRDINSELSKQQNTTVANVTLADGNVQTSNSTNSTQQELPAQQNTTVVNTTLADGNVQTSNSTNSTQQELPAQQNTTVVNTTLADGNVQTSNSTNSTQQELPAQQNTTVVNTTLADGNVQTSNSTNSTHEELPGSNNTRSTNTTDNKKGPTIPLLNTEKDYLLVTLAVEKPDTIPENVRLIPITDIVLKDRTMSVAKIELVPSIKDIDRNSAYLDLEIHPANSSENSPIQRIYYRVRLVNEKGEDDRHTHYISMTHNKSEDVNPTTIYVRGEMMDEYPHIEPGRAIVLNLNELPTHPEQEANRKKRNIDLAQPKLLKSIKTLLVTTNPMDRHIKATIGLENLRGSYKNLLFTLKNQPIIATKDNVEFLVLPRKHIGKEFHYLMIEALPDVDSAKLEPGTINLTVKFPGRQLYFKIVPLKESPKIRSENAKYLRFPPRPNDDNKTVLTVEALDSEPQPGFDSNDEAILLNLENGHDPSMHAVPNLQTIQKYFLVSLADKLPDTIPDTVRFLPLKSELSNDRNISFAKIQMVPSVDNSTYDPNKVYFGVEIHDESKKSSPIRKLYLKIGLVSEKGDNDAYTKYMFMPHRKSKDSQPITIFARVETFAAAPRTKDDGRAVVLKLDELPAFPEDEANRAKRTINSNSALPSNNELSTTTPNLDTEETYLLVTLADKKPRTIPENVRFLPFTDKLLKDRKMVVAKIELIPSLENKDQNSVYLALEVHPADSSENSPIQRVYYRVRRVSEKGDDDRLTHYISMIRNKSEVVNPTTIYVRIETMDKDPHIDPGRAILLNMNELPNYPEQEANRNKRNTDLASAHPELLNTITPLLDTMDGHIKATIDLENLRGSYKHLLVTLKNQPIASKTDNVESFVIPRKHIGKEFQYLMIEALPDVNSGKYEPGTINLTVKFPGRQIYFKIVPLKESPGIKSENAKYLRFPAWPDENSKTVLTVEALDSESKPGFVLNDEAILLNLENGHDPSMQPELPSHHKTSVVTPTPIDGHIEATIDREHLHGSYKHLIVTLKNQPIASKTDNVESFVIPRKHIGDEFHYLLIETLPDVYSGKFEPGTIKLNVKLPGRQLHFKFVPIKEIPGIRSEHAKYLRFPAWPDENSKTVLTVDTLDSEPQPDFVSNDEASRLDDSETVLALQSLDSEPAPGFDSNDEDIVLNLETEDETHRAKRTINSNLIHPELPNHHKTSVVTPTLIDGHIEVTIDLEHFRGSYTHLLVTLKNQPIASKTDSVESFVIPRKHIGDEFQYLMIEALPDADSGKYEPGTINLTVKFPGRQIYFKIVPLKESPGIRSEHAKYLRFPAWPNDDSKTVLTVEALDSEPQPGFVSNDEAIVLNLENGHDPSMQPELPRPHKTSVVTPTLNDGHIEVTIDLEHFRGSYTHLLVTLKNQPIASKTDNVESFVIPRKHIGDEFQYLMIEGLPDADSGKYEPGTINLTVKFPGRQLYFKIVPLKESPGMRSEHAKYLRFPAWPDENSKTILTVEALDSESKPGFVSNDEAILLNLKNGHDPSMLPKLPNHHRTSLVTPTLIDGHIEATIDLEHFQGSYKHLLVTLKNPPIASKTDSVESFVIPRKHIADEFQYLMIEALPDVESGKYEPGTINLTVKFPGRQIYFKIVPLKESPGIRSEHAKYLRFPAWPNDDSKTVLTVEALDSEPQPGFVSNDEAILLNLENGHDPSMQPELPNDHTTPVATPALTDEHIEATIDQGHLQGSYTLYRAKRTINSNSTHPGLPCHQKTSGVNPTLIDGHIELTIDLENFQGSYKHVLVTLKNQPSASKTDNVESFVIPRIHIGEEFQYLMIEALPDGDSGKYEPGTIKLNAKFPGRLLYFNVVPIKESPGQRSEQAMYLRFPPRPDDDSKTVLTIKALDAAPPAGFDANDEAIVLNLESLLFVRHLRTTEKYLLVSLALKLPDTIPDTVQFLPIASELVNDRNVYNVKIERLRSLDNITYDQNAVYLSVDVPKDSKENSPMREFYFKMELVSGQSAVDPFTQYIFSPNSMLQDGRHTKLYARIERVATQPQIPDDGSTALLTLEELPDLSRRTRSVTHDSKSSSSAKRLVRNRKIRHISTSTTFVKHRSLLMKVQQREPTDDNVQFVAIKSPLLKDASVKYVKVIKIDSIDYKYYEPDAKFLTISVPINEDPDAPLQPMYFKVVPMRGRIKHRQHNAQYLQLPSHGYWAAADTLYLTVKVVYDKSG